MNERLNRATGSAKQAAARLTQVESSTASPAYKQLAAMLREEVLRGKFPPGRKLPTESELAAHYAISRQTVRQAFADLVAEGLVYRVRGRGTFATPRRLGPYLRSVGSIHELLAISVDTELEVIQPPHRRVDFSVATQLHLESDEVVSLVHRRIHEGLPFMVTTAYLPLSVAEAAGVYVLAKVGQRTPETLIAMIDRSPAGPLAGGHQSATAIAMPAELAGYIDCVAGQSVLQVERLYYNREGRPVELAVSQFNPQRYSYRLELRR